MLRSYLLCAFLFVGSCAPRSVEPLRRDAPFQPEKRQYLRIVLVGDTGHPSKDMERVSRAIKAERKDVVVALGDLAYPLTPECPDGRAIGQAREQLDWKLGKALGAIGAPVLLVMGNHDVPRGESKSAREACLVDYAAQRDDFVLPDLTYSVDYGVAILAVANTQNLQDADGRKLADALRGHSGWKIGLGHHVYKTYRDKITENVVRPWLKKHDINIDVWANGHAHLLQLGVYDGVPAITSGTASLRREKPTCPPHCGDGELYGSSEAGYALLELWPTRLKVTFKDGDGEVLHSWSTQRVVTKVAPSVDKVKASGP